MFRRKQTKAAEPYVSDEFIIAWKRPDKLGQRRVVPALAAIVERRGELESLYASLRNPGSGHRPVEAFVGALQRVFNEEETPPIHRRPDHPYEKIRQFLAMHHDRLLLDVVFCFEESYQERLTGRDGWTLAARELLTGLVERPNDPRGPWFPRPSEWVTEAVG